MRILLVNKYWREAGGVENHAFAVRDWLQARGHEVIPFAMREEETISTPHNIYFPEFVEFRGGFSKETVAGLRRAIVSDDSVAALRRLIREQKPDVAYVLHVYHQLGTRVLDELSKNDIPFVLSLHDYKVGCANYRYFNERTGQVCTKCLDSPGSWKYQPAVQRCWNGSAVAGGALIAESVATRLRKSYSKASVITVLNSLQEQMITRADLGVTVMRLPHPVELQPARMRPDDGNFLFIGRLVPEKGVDLLLKAAAAAKVRLRIVGEGRAAESLHRLNESLGSPADFVGGLSHAETLQELRNAKVLCVPSIWHEVSPLVVLEAIANGVPVVATALGGMVDQLGDSRGILVDSTDPKVWANTLLWVNEHGEELASMAARASRHAESFWSEESWSRGLASAFAQAGVAV